MDLYGFIRRDLTRRLLKKYTDSVPEERFCPTRIVNVSIQIDCMLTVCIS